MTAINTENPKSAICTPESKCAPRQFVTPEVNIYETKDGYVLKADLPGVSKAGLDITLEGNELTIIGHRNAGNSVQPPLYRESLGVDYRRVFELDPAIDTARINAQVEQGVLTLHLPKSEEVKPRKITVTE